MSAPLADIARQDREERARIDARERLRGRIEGFCQGLTLLGFAPSVDRDPGGRLRITIDADAWEPPNLAPLAPPQSQDA